MHILWWIIVGLIAGWLTGKIMKGAGYGIIGGFILGILGAVIGGFIMRSMRSMGFAGQGGLLYTILVALGGAVVLTAVVRVLKTA
ncbi:MAG: GlsB/YeaQ/YmgE family stress response membrane protein [Acidobacteria bacterium]|nr:MAG: GlsB/YeaQ/YmgE family stress response membrane protein [Acidobacteriota bacterium]